jgi:beta-glucosidase
MYVSFPDINQKNVINLKGFKKIELAPNESKTVAFTLRDRDLSMWSLDIHDWKLQEGEF